MTKRNVNIFVKWLRIEIKPYEIPKGGIKFFAQMLVEDEGVSLPNWTVEVVITSAIDIFTCYGKLRYIANEAPNNLLIQGKKFILFDGPNAIADGEILDNFNEY